MADAETQERPGRSGSDTRQKTRMLGFRATPAEEAQIILAADQAGLSVAGFMRACAVRRATTRAQRRPTIDQVIAAQYLRAFNRVGANVYQLVRAQNFADPATAAELRSAAEACRKAADACHAVIQGREP
jgi:hypothetical protein